MFQSTPPAEARGDPTRDVRETAPTELKVFQSTPPAEARGDGWQAFLKGLSLLETVSIHSPRRSEGRQQVAITRSWSMRLRMFQSTPPAEARGDAEEMVES